MPIGSQVVLTDGRITLEYGQSELVKIGITSQPIEETWVSVAYNKSGIPVQGKRLYPPKVSLELELHLTFDRLSELELLYFLHKRRTRHRRIPWVQLIDKRLPFVDAGARTRTLATGTSELGNAPRHYYPVYRVALTWKGYDLIGSLAGEPVFEVRLTAWELDLSALG